MYFGFASYTPQLSGWAPLLYFLACWPANKTLPIQRNTTHPSYMEHTSSSGLHRYRSPSTDDSSNFHNPNSPHVVLIESSATPSPVVSIAKVTLLPPDAEKVTLLTGASAFLAPVIFILPAEGKSFPLPSNIVKVRKAIRPLSWVLTRSPLPCKVLAWVFLSSVFCFLFLLFVVVSCV